jgi:hypothetical protein
MSFMFLSSFARANKPLFFPANKNNIQTLPQSFEYTMVDSEKIKIGDILIDATLLRFELIRPPEESRVKLLFSWPAGLLQEGGIYLVNNNGQAIWDSPILKKNITIAKADSKKDENTQLRTDLAQMTSELLPPEVFENMRYYPFMKFCVSQSRGDTRVELCSKELYLSMIKGQVAIKGRASNRNEATVTVNGKKVTDQGSIFLNDVTQIISFRAEAVSGATLNIETRRKNVEFRDVTIGKDSKTLVFEAQGADPVTETNVVRLRNGNWRTTLPIERPVIYLQGEGGIPLRQEFFVRGAPPKAEARAYLNSETPSKTYNSEVIAIGTTPPGTQIKNLPKDPQTLRPLNQNDRQNDSQNNNQNKFRWIMGGMVAGQTNNHFAQVTAGDGSWVGGYDIYRGYSTEVALMATALAPWSLALYNLEIHYWFENFLGLSSPLFLQRWGLGVSQGSSFSNKSGSPSYSFTQVNLTTRFSPGLNYKDPSWGLNLKPSNLTLNKLQISTFGFGLFYRGPSTVWGTGKSGWMTFTLDYLFPAKTSDLDFKGMTKIQALFERPFWSRYFFDYGITCESWGPVSVPQTEATTSTVDTFQLGLTAGFRALF